MNASLSNEFSATESQQLSWRLADLFVGALWCSIAIGVFAGRQLLMPIFEDFEVALPTATAYLLSFHAGVSALLVAFAVLLLLYLLPSGGGRAWFKLAAGIAGILLAVALFLGCLVPLISLWSDLA